MGLFDFLKSDKATYSDKVWMTKDAALKGMMTEALQSLTKGEVPIVLSFFEDKQHEVVEFVTSRNVRYSVIDMNSTTRSNQSVLLMNAQWLNSSTQAIDFVVQLSNVAVLNILFYGHYPLPEKENQLLNKISNSVKPMEKLTFFSSLDDRAFEMFGADNIKSIMEKMGLKEDEAIEHAMVTKSMARAREKIAADVPQEIISQTESGWYNTNYKKT